jgi:Putative Actinobacterial Holin-X, holin superfamily III
MNALINRLISEATAPIEKTSARLFKKAVLFFVALSCLFVSSIFLTIALFVFVQPLAGTAMAALGTGVLYLGVALICIVVASREGSRPAARAAAKSCPKVDSNDTPPRQNLAFPSNIDEAVAPVLDILRDAGLERERLALAAGMEIAKQLHPFSLVALAIVAGFILGRILKQRRIPLI